MVVFGGVLLAVVLILAPVALAFWAGWKSNRPTLAMWFVTGSLLTFALGATYFITLMVKFYQWKSTVFDTDSGGDLMLLFTLVYIVAELWFMWWINMPLLMTAITQAQNARATRSDA